MITFYFVRHGQTEFNTIKRIQGRSCDSPLTEKGIADAELAAQALKDVPFDRAYTSPSGRAVKTAEIILASHHMKAQPLEDLMEYDFGSLDGAFFPPHRDEVLKHRDMDDFTAFGGDNAASISIRIHHALQTMIAQSAEGDHILAVTHGEYTLHLLSCVFGIAIPDFRAAHTDRQFPVPNGGITEFTWDGSFHLIQEPIEPQKFHDSLADK